LTQTEANSHKWQNFGSKAFTPRTLAQIAANLKYTQESKQPLMQQPQSLAVSGSMHDSVSSEEQRSGELREEAMDAESKAERTKAKNKKAQKKFRQKQKERHAELERSAAELSERLKRTLGEVDALQNQKKVLEIALSRNVEAAVSATPSTQVAILNPLVVGRDRQGCATNLVTKEGGSTFLTGTRRPAGTAQT